jgi:hypothetical protein
LHGKYDPIEFPNKIPYKNGFIFVSTEIPIGNIGLSKLLIQNYSGITTIDLANVSYIEKTIDTTQLLLLRRI